MILSVSRRTDIPCRYAEWFMNRVRAGYALTRNPMNHARLYRVPLTPDLVDAVVFWTKDPLSLLPHLDELDRRGYRYCFQFTLTPYGRDLEPGLREKSAIADTFIALSKRIGRDRVIWRYDPIILNDAHDMAYHKDCFSRLCDRLAPYTDTVTVSFVDLYTKLKTPLIRPISTEERAVLGGFIGEAAAARGIAVTACCEADDLTAFGIRQASCIDRARLEKLCGCCLDLVPDKNQRSGCGCCESVDIGAYDTCPNGCVYCYANRSPVSAGQRHAVHDPKSPLLYGAAAEGESIADRKVKSNKRDQTIIY